MYLRKIQRADSNLSFYYIKEIEENGSNSREIE
jgi:hypothetical protein